MRVSHTSIAAACLQHKRRSWSFEYMHRLLFAGRLEFTQARVLPLQSKVSSGGCIVRRASMSLYPTLDIKGQTVLITGEQLRRSQFQARDYTHAVACTAHQ